MYKVFIQNKPLFFISPEEMQNVEGVFIREGLALSDKQQINNLLKFTNRFSPIYILCENPAETMDLYFQDYAKIEAAGGIVQRKSKYLFIKRNGFWDLPKGKMEKNETPRECAIREIEEECGIENVSIDKELLITYHTYENLGVSTLKKTYWFTLNYQGSKKGIPQLEEGITKISWKKNEKFDVIKKNTFQSIIDVLDAFDVI
jgi:8-oxo-dGTP pyrophosphatase MutT (NUDIX family)